MAFSIIAAIGKNRELGRDNQLIWRLPEDMRYFKEVTMGHPIMMGHRTFDSLPGVLPGRKHYVVTRHEALEGAPEEVELVNNLQNFVAAHKSAPEEIFVIGGGMLYWEMLKHCDKLYLTEVDAETPDADTFFPEFDKKGYTCEVIRSGREGDIRYDFVVYTKKDQKME